MSERPNVDSVFSGDPKEKIPPKSQNKDPYFIDSDKVRRRQFRDAVLKERLRQKAIGFGYKHDKKAGPIHLLKLAYRFIYEGDSVKAAAMIFAAQDVIDESTFKWWQFAIGFMCGMLITAFILVAFFIK